MWWLLAGCDRDPCARGVPVDSVDDAVALVAELPAPVTLACFVSALERPLGIELTSDVFSTQPAQGPRSPRILVHRDAVTLTFVPVGQGRDLLEFGERAEEGLTTKAEIAFPVVGALDPGEPYERTLAAPGAGESGCRVCHFEEREVSPGRFANTRLRPPDDFVVPVPTLEEEAVDCDAAADAYRCELLSALFDHGEVTERRSPEDVATGFGPAP